MIGHTSTTRSPRVPLDVPKDANDVHLTEFQPARRGSVSSERAALAALVGYGIGAFPEGEIDVHSLVAQCHHGIDLGGPSRG